MKAQLQGFNAEHDRIANQGIEIGDAFLIHHLVVTSGIIRGVFS